MSAKTRLRVSDLAEMVVRRVSVGSSLARAAWTGFIRAAKAIAEEGSFEGLEGSVTFAELGPFSRGSSKPVGVIQPAAGQTCLRAIRLDSAIRPSI